MYREMIKLSPEEILVYLRKSRSDDPSLTTEEVLAKHETILREWIERNLDTPIPEENWYREVVSGETIEKREEFQKVLKRIESKSIKAVLCLECSRLSRGDLMENGYILNMFRYSSTMILTPMKWYDLSDEYDRDAFERELKRGNEYLEYTKKTLYRGRQLSVSQGWYIASVPPYGYNRVWVMEGKRKRPTLEINEKEAEVVRMVFDMYLHEGIGVQAIANRIDKLGVIARNGKRFSRSLARDILRNEHYMGKVVWKRRPLTKVVENSEIVRKRDLSAEVMLFDGKHEALISEEDFYKAQEITNNMPKVNIDFTLKNPLSTIMYCKCGYIMTMTNTRGKYRYRCKDYLHCKTSSIEAPIIIDAVCNAIKQEIEDFEVKVNEDTLDDKERLTREINVLERRILECEKKELSLWEKYTEEGMPKTIFDKLLSKNTEEKERASKQLKTLSQTVNIKSNYEDTIATLHEALDAIKDGEASATEQNRLLKACISKITYGREPSVRVNSEYKGETKNGWTVPDLQLDIEFKV